ncbi:hypothetical protein [Streptomyces xylophagus]|uniref:hypothetical protein n=1 Tax=Streptomyces xylophagus TaxID=285514 RepID=UPI0007C50929|nr:hypothetical protein [Streptomyces xylophagus]
MALLRAPVPLGYGHASKEAHSIAAPLLTGAALALAGVVAAADKDKKIFYWPGVSLLMLVATSMALLASIQLHHYSRQFSYSRQDIHDWHDLDDSPADEALLTQLYAWQGDDYGKWARNNDRAVHCFNAGTVLLGLGVVTVLIPPDGGQQAPCRWAAAGLVLLCTVVEVAWTLAIYRKTTQLRRERGSVLSAIAKPRENA